MEKLKLPSQAAINIENDLAEHLLGSCRERIIEGCVKYIPDGPKIAELVKIGSLESLKTGIRLRDIDNLKALFACKNIENTDDLLYKNLVTFPEIRMVLNKTSHLPPENARYELIKSRNKYE